MKTKKAQVVMLPTEDKSQILLHKQDREISFNNILIKEDMLRDNPQHLYITTEDEIKEGDWYIVPINFGNGGKYVKESLAQFKLTDSLKDYKKFGARKVIATTDKSLFIEDYCSQCNNDGYTTGPMGVEFECTKCPVKLLPQPSQAFIEKYCKVGGIDEVLVEYEKIYSHTIKTGMIGTSNQKIYINKLKIDSHNTITIHPIKNNFNLNEIESVVKSLSLNDLKQTNEEIWKIMKKKFGEL